MKKVFKKINKLKFAKLVIFFLVLYFTFVLRAHNFDRTPGTGHLEEMLYAWSGLYLIETGVPVSWSTLDYPKRAEVFKGRVDFQGGDPMASVTLYKPWLDEPPLFSLLVGAFAHYYNADRNDVIPASYIRTPIVIISAATSILVFLTASLVSGFWTGILAMLLYGTIPIMVFGSRLAVPENLIALFLMITVFLLLKFEIKPRFWYLGVIALLAGIGGLAKPTGYFLLPLAIYFALSKKQYKNIIFLVITIIPFIAFFFWYGLHFDSEIFWRIFSIQGQRPVGFSSLGWFFTSPAYDIRMLTDSWYIFSLLAAGFFIFKPKEGLAKWISIFFIYWVIIIMLSGGEADLLPWYRYPVFPLLAIFAAWGVQFIVKEANFLTTFLAAGFFLGNRFLLVNAFRTNVLPGHYRAIFSGLMLPAVLNFIYHKPWLETLNRLIIVIIIIFGLFFNIQYIYNRFELECESITCAMTPSTKLSTAYFPVFWRWLVLGESTYK